MATINPDAVEVRPPDPAATAGMATLPVGADLPEPKTRVVDFIKGDPRSVPLTEAGIVVAGGKGLGCGENFKLVADLADAIGGSVAASRPAVDEEWVGRERQVGLTGKTVRPRLYIACGISGAIQHTMGMKDAATIVAINIDRNAPIFKLADVCVVGDVLEVLPALTARLRQVLANGPGKPDPGQVLDAVSKG
jgi:electron transfer flavoprotein alpha subunit